MSNDRYGAFGSLNDLPGRAVVVDMAVCKDDLVDVRKTYSDLSERMLKNVHCFSVPVSSRVTGLPGEKVGVYRPGLSPGRGRMILYIRGYIS